MKQRRIKERTNVLKPILGEVLKGNKDPARRKGREEKHREVKRGEKLKQAKGEKQEEVPTIPVCKYSVTSQSKRSSHSSPLP